MPSFAAPQGLGLNTASTTYGDGGATTRTTGMGMPGGNDDLLNFFKELARRRMAPPAAAPTPERPHVGGRGLHHRPPVQGPDGFREFAERQHMLHQLSNEADESTLAPMHYITQAGQTYLDPDVKRMTANQRKLFLPDSSSMQGNINVPSEASLGPDAPPQAAPAIDDDSWRRQAFLSQNPYASGLMNKFQVQD